MINITDKVNHSVASKRQRIMWRMNDEQDQTPIAASASPASAPGRQRASRAPWLIAAAVVVVLIIVGVAEYFVLHSRNTPAKQAATKQTEVVAPDTTTSSGLATYTSKGQDLNLSFSYPASWSATPKSGGNSSDQPITVTSPVITLSSAAGQSVNGKVVLQIRPGGSDVTELDGSNASVALDSIQIAYTKPTPNQNLYPFITFVHLTPGANTNAVFEEVVITGINKFIKGQALLAGSLGSVSPIISVSFYQCNTQACTGSGATPLSLTSSLWDNSLAGQQALAIFQSFQIN